LASNGAHTLSVSEATLGPTASAEVDANDPNDPDGVPNLTNTDSDDGVTNFFINLISIPPPTDLTVEVHGNTSGTFYLNVLIDLNMDGRWGGVAGGGEAEWVVQNYPVSVTPGITSVTPPSFAFANGNRLPDGAWARFALTSEMVTGTNWDGSGTFNSGEIEDHVVGLPLGDGKCIPLLVVENDGPYPVPGAGGLVICTVTVTNLRNCAGSFNWTLTPLPGDVICAPLLGGPEAIAEAGDPGDEVDILIDATNGTRDSQWLFTATAVDPNFSAVAGGFLAGCSGISETILEFFPKKIHIEDFFGWHQCGTQCKLHAEAWIEDENENPVPGATVTFEITAPGGSKTRLTAVTDEDGCAEIDFTVTSHDTYTVEVVEVTGDGMEYVPGDNTVDTSISVHG